MKASQRLALDVAKARAACNVATISYNENDDESRSEELRAVVETATAGLTSAESKYTITLAAEVAMESTETEEFVGGGDPESRERESLVSRANLGSIFAAVLDHGHTEGAEREAQQAHGLGMNQIPLAMLRPTPDEIEMLAVTPSPGNTSRTQRPTVQPVFAGGDAAFLRVAMPTVDVGAQSFPVLTSRPSVTRTADAGEVTVAETTGAFSAESLVPQRIQASFYWKRVDAAKFRNMEPSLRAALTAGLGESLDDMVIDQIVSDVARTDASAVDTFASYRSRLVYGQLDGRFAPSEADIRILAGAPTVSSMSAKYRGNNADDSAVDSIRRIAGGLRVSAHIAAVASHKQDAIIRKGGRMDAVAPVWQGVTIIPDELTKAATGEIVLTAVALAVAKVIRTAGFARVQHA